jgi:cobaltochelatase CobS
VSNDYENLLLKILEALMVANETNGNEAQVMEYSELFQRFAGAIQEHLNLNPSLDEQAVIDLVDKRVNQIAPRPVEIRIGGEVTAVMNDRVHTCFEQLVSVINEGNNNVLMVGPAGSGKTTLGKNLAKALDCEFGFISLSAGVTEAHLFGRILPQPDGSWQYVISQFVHIYESGGVFLLDEIDAADPNVMVSINAALANGMFANPVNGKVHHRHEKTIIIAAGNTWGRGGDAMYVGRNQLDAATMDRFVLSTVHVDYDTDLEKAIVLGILPKENQAEEVIEWVTDLREKITGNRLRRIASTRLVLNTAKAIAAGSTMSEVKKRYFVDWSVDELNRVGEKK